MLDARYLILVCESVVYPVIPVIVSDHLKKQTQLTPFGGVDVHPARQLAL